MSTDVHPSPPQPLLTLYLIRHGQAEGNVRRVVQGSADLPLTERGRQQATLLARRLAQEVQFDLLVTSPLQRAHATAQAIAQATGAPLHLGGWLREIDTGDMAGLSWTEAQDRHPEVFGRPVEDIEGFPGGETLVEFNRRVQEGFAALVEEHLGSARTVGLVGHSGSLKAIVAALLDLDRVPFERIFFGETSVSHVVYRRRGGQVKPQIRALNDTTHLQNVG